MKKVYITPSLLMLEVEMEQMIAVSIPLDSEPAAGDYPGGGEVKYFDDILDDSEDW